MWVCPCCGATFPEGRFCPLDGIALTRTTGTVAIPGMVIERELGRGLTGSVWRGRAIADGRAVAIKLLHREWIDHGEMRERFERECRAGSSEPARAPEAQPTGAPKARSGSIVHPCVVAPLASGTTDDGRPYLVMELVDGPSLEDVLALGPLPPVRAAAIASDLASALAAVHRAGVLHRDVKPGNVRIGSDGRARLLDFGVARRIDGDDPRLTQGGLAVGTPHYMAPEQCSGDPETGRSDVYGLGCVLYRMLAGEVPFDGPGVAVMLAHVSRAPAPLGPEVPTALASLVMRCLAKRAGDRPDAVELAEALEAFVARGTMGDRALETRVRFGRAGTIPAGDRSLREACSGPAPGTGPEAAQRRAGSAPEDRAPRHLARTLGLAAIAVALGLGAWRMRSIGHGLSAAIDDAPTAHAPPPRSLPPADAALRFLIADDDDEGISLRLGTPAVLVAGDELELTLEAWDQDGVALDTTDLVITFADPAGRVAGLAAEPTRTRGVYRVRTRFAAPGGWTVRVFPPRGDSMVQFHLDVAKSAGVT